MKMKKNSSTEVGKGPNFFELHPRDVLENQRLPFPLFSHNGGHWIRFAEAGLPFDGGPRDVQVYAESKERMAWVSCLLSILDSANHLDTQDRVRVLIQAGLDLLIGWEKEPTRPEYIQLAHRWTSIIACPDSHQDIELFWMHIGNDSGRAAHSVRCAVVLAEITRSMPLNHRTRQWVAFMGLGHDLGHAVMPADEWGHHAEASLGLLAVRARSPNSFILESNTTTSAIKEVVSHTDWLVINSTGQHACFHSSSIGTKPNRFVAPEARFEGHGIDSLSLMDTTTTITGSRPYPKAFIWSPKFLTS